MPALAIPIVKAAASSSAASAGKKKVHALVL